MKIYVISESVNGPCKIGIGGVPLKRLRALQVGNPRRLRLVQVWDAESALRIERMAHNFAGYANQLIGEWFSISEAQAIVAVEKALIAPAGEQFDWVLPARMPRAPRREPPPKIRYVSYAPRVKTKLPYTPPNQRITLFPGQVKRD